MPTFVKEQNVKSGTLNRGLRWAIAIVVLVMLGIGLAWSITHRPGRVITSGFGAGEGGYRERVFLLDKLPSAVSAPADQITLFADYGDVNGEGVAMYLVNRTKDECQIPYQDPDIYAKLEIRLPDGTWQRAQTHHYSFCGNSYGTLHLQPGQFLTLRGFHSSEGETYPVRYRLYGKLDVRSNVGTGKVTRAKIDEAAGDPMAIRNGSLALVQKVLAEGIPTKDDYDARSRYDSAIFRLGKLPAVESVPVLKKLLSDVSPDSPRFSSLVHRLYQHGANHWADAARPILASEPSKKRSLFLFHSQWVAKDIGDQSLIEELFHRANNPQAPDLRMLFALLAGQEDSVVRSRARTFLERVQSDARYSRSLQEAALYELARAQGDQKLRVSVAFPGKPTRQPAPPYPLIVTLKNTSDKTIDFRYRVPSDIVSIHLETEHQLDGTWRAREFIPPRPGIQWFSEVRDGGEKVSLRPGSEWKLNVSLADFFDILPGNPSQCLVWIRCKLPNVHDVPQMSDGAPCIQL